MLSFIIYRLLKKIAANGRKLLEEAGAGDLAIADFQFLSSRKAPLPCLWEA